MLQTRKGTRRRYVFPCLLHNNCSHSDVTKIWKPLPQHFMIEYEKVPSESSPRTKLNFSADNLSLI